MSQSTHSTQDVRNYPPKPTAAYLFATCLIDQFAPEAGLDTVRLLEREGIAIHFPKEQTCCGQLHLRKGGKEEEERERAPADANARAAGAKWA